MNPIPTTNNKNMPIWQKKKKNSKLLTSRIKFRIPADGTFLIFKLFFFYRKTKCTD